MNLIFDIGFNVGEFTQTCFNKYPNCNVVAVEANPTLVNNAPPHFFTNYNFTLHNNFSVIKTILIDLSLCNVM
jgi:tRNA G46 methylase TrmB